LQALSVGLRMPEPQELQPQEVPPLEQPVQPALLVSHLARQAQERLPLAEQAWLKVFRLAHRRLAALLAHRLLEQPVQRGRLAPLAWPAQQPLLQALV